ncbi:asparagine synthetase domain-containing protein 1-like [Ruditapes philippinarum]|uniref:asparagine synthetase domain-containing protein 1-like n=1 Tax=Ruditapes philippinarum TaxID=129788 RepID=UPI00295B0998|nr:asparagine synthetase domain-containing protein 1-like [Ruditapes philippinarum]
MCGICLLLFEKENSEKFNLDDILKKSRLCNRGPDKSKDVKIDIAEHLSAVFTGHVLHLRGDEMAVQPAQDSQGNLLLWNGEIFGGINVPESKSDTTVLLELLGQCSSESQITAVFAQVQGPWSFIYWQADTKTLWFGRDVFGRRSLLWHLPESHDEAFILCSVQIKPWRFKEVPAVGIYKMTCSQTESQALNTITLFPWKCAVWPGTLDIVQTDPDFATKIYSCEKPSDIVEFKISDDLAVSSQLPILNKSLPSADYTLPELTPDQAYLDYLQNLLDTNSYLRTLSRQLTGVLLEAVRTRVFNQHVIEPCSDDNSTICHAKKSDGMNVEACMDGAANDVAENGIPCDSHMTTSSRVAILFSGGIDSTMIAALADKCLPIDEPIDLLNVAFELKPKPSGRKEKWDVPDRLTGYTALAELNPDRQWNFIEVNVTAEELQKTRSEHIQDLVYPLQTVLDDSIGCAVWFASRGIGVLGNGQYRGTNICSKARVILCGMGADEQLVGYSRHRVRYKEEGWKGLINEIELEVTRISSRNLGRDDRIITDHGKESRFPFLDERVVQFLSSLPVHEKANLDLPRGLGEKLLLRLSATELGLHQTATLAKRAIQFGSRIAKLENNKEKATDICSRLTNVSHNQNKTEDL